MTQVRHGGSTPVRRGVYSHPWRNYVYNMKGKEMTYDEELDSKTGALLIKSYGDLEAFVNVHGDIAIKQDNEEFGKETIVFIPGASWPAFVEFINKSLAEFKNV